MTEDDKINEHLKLLATWMNTIAAGIIGAGTIVPAVNYIHDFLPATIEPWHIYFGAVICVVTGIFIHLTGHLVVTA